MLSSTKTKQHCQPDKNKMCSEKSHFGAVFPEKWPFARTLFKNCVQKQHLGATTSFFGMTGKFRKENF